TINADFITGLRNPFLAVDSNNHLFVANNDKNTAGQYTVGQYDAATGAAINATFISGLVGPSWAVVDGNNHLFVESRDATGLYPIVGEYDATTGATISANFVSVSQGLVTGGAMALDKLHNHLFVADYNETHEFDATTGATINFHFANTIGPLAVDGLNHLFAGSPSSGALMELDATTGATINPNFIPGGAGL